MNRPLLEDDAQLCEQGGCIRRAGFGATPRLAELGRDELHRASRRPVQSCNVNSMTYRISTASEPPRKYGFRILYRAYAGFVIHRGRV